MLTTVRQDAQAIGRSAAELLLKKLNGQRADRPVFLPVSLIERGSIRNLKEEAKASRKKA
jgi:DNA-binding LacI/PurR family transcriptional regulator